MIIFEERIQELISVLPPITEGEGESAKAFPVNFYWAKDIKDVNLYLSKKNQPYPLIILVRSPEKLKNRVCSEVTRKSRFILATAERDINKLNTERWQSSYKNILNPLADTFLEALESSSISRLHDDLELDRVPNYADVSMQAGKDLENQIDIWDTIVLDCTVSINDNCLKPLIWENL